MYSPATFERDRYSFALPKNLEEKMIAGDLIADFKYVELPERMLVGGKRIKVPDSIILEDRYE